MFNDIGNKMSKVLLILFYVLIVNYKLCIRWISTADLRLTVLLGTKG